MAGRPLRPWPLAAGLWPGLALGEGEKQLERTFEDRRGDGQGGGRRACVVAGLVHRADIIAAMPSRLAAAAIAVALLAACRPGGSPAASPAPSPSLSATPSLVLAAPARAILDRAAGLPPTASRDHLSGAEYVASAANQVVAMDRVTAWGWADASYRAWASGGRSVSVLVVMTDREQGAAAAYAAWAQDAATAPFSAGPCPPGTAGLDQCTVGAAGGRSIAVGRLGAVVFRLEATGVEAAPLVTTQAERLRL